MTVSTKGTNNLNCPSTPSRVCRSAKDTQLGPMVHYFRVTVSWLDTAETVLPPSEKVYPSGGQSQLVPLKDWKTA